MVQKTFCLLVLVFCLLAPTNPVAVKGEKKSYTIEELSLSLSLPTDMAVVMRGQASVLPGMGMDTVAIQEYMLENDVYLSAMTLDYSMELMIAMEEDQTTRNIWDYGLVEQSELRDAFPSFEESYSDENFSATVEGLYQGDQAVFFIIDMENPGNEDGAEHLRQYFSIYNGQSISVTAFFYEEEQMEEQKKALQSIVDGMVFIEVLTAPPNRSVGSAGSYVLIPVGAIIYALRMLFRRQENTARTVPPYLAVDAFFSGETFQYGGMSYDKEGYLQNSMQWYYTRGAEQRELRKAQKRVAKRSLRHVDDRILSALDTEAIQRLLDGKKPGDGIFDSSQGEN